MQTTHAKGNRMTRMQRSVSSTDIYHVIDRGAGRRLLFEDDADRLFFLGKLSEFKDQNGADVLAWCLMGNHAHLLVRCPADSLVRMMRSLNTSFGRYYNGRHAHVGPVFQDRYKSYPVESEAYLMETVRYIHLNPQSAGIGRCDEYEWSSYRSYFEEESLCDTTFILNVFGGEGPFVAFHQDAADHQEILDLVSDGEGVAIRRSTIPDGEAVELAKTMFGDEFANAIASMPKADRDAAIRRLKGCGLSIRQIERLTGIGRGIIQKC